MTTKLWIHSGEEAAKRAFAASLERLGLDYVDLFCATCTLPATTLTDSAPTKFSEAA